MARQSRGAQRGSPQPERDHPRYEEGHVHQDATAHLAQLARTDAVPAAAGAPVPQRPSLGAPPRSKRRSRLIRATRGGRQGRGLTGRWSRHGLRALPRAQRRRRRGGGDRPRRRQRGVARRRPGAAEGVRPLRRQRRGHDGARGDDAAVDRPGAVAGRQHDDDHRHRVGPAVGDAHRALRADQLGPRPRAGSRPSEWDDRRPAPRSTSRTRWRSRSSSRGQELTAILALGFTRAAETVLTAPYSVTAVSAEYGWMGFAPHRATILDSGLQQRRHRAMSSPRRPHLVHGGLRRRDLGKGFCRQKTALDAGY